MTEEEFFEFAKKVEADLIAHDPTWAEYPFGTEEGLLEQYSQTFDNVGTIFYYYVFTNTVTEESTRMTALLDMSRDDLVDPGDGIPDIPLPTPPEASDLVFYGPNAPETPALSPIWFDTETGDIRIWYNFEGGQTWVNTGVAGVGKIQLMNDLQDVDLTTTPIADDNILQYDIASNTFLPVDLNNTYALTSHKHSHTIIQKGIDFSILSSDGKYLLYDIIDDINVTINTATVSGISVGETVVLICNTPLVTFDYTNVTIKIQPSKQLLFSEDNSIIYITYIADNTIYVSGDLKAV